MDLSRHTSAEAILLNQGAADKRELLEHMIDTLLAANGWGREGSPDRQAVQDAIWRREQAGSTCMGQGVAFPHGRIRGLGRLAACLAVLKTPLAWGGADEQKVELACLYVVPEEDPTIGIRVMAAVSELLSDPHARQYLREADDPGEVWAFIHEKQLLMDRPIRARDIMQPEVTDIRRDEPLREVTRKMLHRHTDVLPVCDAEGEVLGQVTCDGLFRRGIPDFFTQLASVSFVKQFDPFESYFGEEARAVAGDVMSADAPCVGEDDTLMEILFQLSVRNHSKVYVVHERKLLGSIDRITVLDRVIHL